MKKTIVLAAIFAALAAPALAAVPGAQVKNANANANACWGQDRSYYAAGAAREDLGWTNMDIKQSFPTNVGDERRAWVETYCDPHGPA